MTDRKLKMNIKKFLLNILLNIKLNSLIDKKFIINTNNSKNEEFFSEIYIKNTNAIEV